jgi:hypothetical protein
MAPEDKQNVTPVITSKADAIELCERLLKNTADIISVLDRETELLRKVRSAEMEAIATRKTSLGAVLAHDMSLLKQNAQYISRIAPEQIAMLKEQNRRFSRSLEINHDALQAMKNISENLIRNIAEKASAVGPEVYGSNASYQRSPGNTNSAISVNSTV